MPRLLPWTSVEVGDLDIFAPAVPCLLVYTWYVDGEPDSTVTYFWQDENTGLVHHELLLNAPISYEAAMAWAQEHAATSDIERIHVRHARAKAPGRGRKKGTRGAAKTRRAPAKARPAAKRKVKVGKAKRKPSSRRASGR
jgi:hypothetical protein